MNRLNKLTVEKFRILKDPELKEIIGRESRGLMYDCIDGGSCDVGASCFGRPHDIFVFEMGTCVYSDFQCYCQYH